MGRSDRCRVGGLFVDYGVISRSLVEAGEVWEHSEADQGDCRKTNPLDTLVDTITEVDIDHVFIVGSAWLRFKIAQRLQQRLGAPAEVGRAAPSAVVCGNGLTVHLFMLDATECAVPTDDAFFKRQCWLQYFFGTRTSAVRPALLTVDVPLVRLVVLGRCGAGSTATLMPMADCDAGPLATPSTGQCGVPLAYVLPQDVDLTGRILALSAATELEELPDGTLRRIPFAVFESRVRRGVVMGFALVESVSSGRMSVLTNAVGVRKDMGLCFMLTEERLTAHALPPGSRAAI
ncbi:putative mucin-associated surface protein (MASP) [Trypanosoma grayi]|uniref:putative mucin-associated surface protein (MASP) n=1 Tax=Trypanosoma grayi TaxID=71804 RepID=UPI0004F42F93|nr:putative mucin-associated surface protein (MASP) [Trypanosoma grayi]KEG06763.1 putative mucin-associated surface protein (MASP) [Trypanosoma grayi]